jgi:anti-sigma factor RsiW
LGRPLNKHLDSHELDALAPSPCATGRETQEIPATALREAWWHAEACPECSGKVSKYGQLLKRPLDVRVPDAAPLGNACSTLQDDDWRDIAAGVWPESKATQLIAHAAFCDHCGPMLRRAVSVDVGRHAGSKRRAPGLPGRWAFTRWLAPVAALLVIVGFLSTKPWSARPELSGSKFAQFAVDTHRQHSQGRLALAVRAGSQQELNEWLRAKSPFPVALPASPIEAGEQRPYDLEGAQLIRVAGKPAAFIAYQVEMPKAQTTPASLLVTPDSVAIASGGIEVAFKKVSFHYASVDGYKVVTWSVHGLTYALVSEEGNGTQRSCMVCHSAMKDRDLSHTPSPLHLEGNTSRPVWQ